MTLSEIESITDRIHMTLFGRLFWLRVEKDNRAGDRIFLQVCYYDVCRNTGFNQEWHGRKWYLSEFMLADEIIKTAYAAFKAAVEHETMEAFTVDGKVLFNPHVSCEALLAITDQEVSRAKV